MPGKVGISVLIENIGTLIAAYKAYMDVSNQNNEMFMIKDD